MKFQSQSMAIGLAVAFAMALALSVALICLSHAQQDLPPSPDMGTDSAQNAEQNGNVHDTSAQAPPTVSTENGLRFTSNGNGTCFLSGIGEWTDACVVIPEFSPIGDRVTEIAPMALFECKTVTAIQIPASVERIGDLAFAACPNLAYISVSDASPYFCDTDGVLYTADRSVLILYPAMRAGSSVAISNTTAKISDMAFYNCRNLTRISFEGTPAQWESIAIGSQNYSLTAAAKTFLEN